MKRQFLTLLFCFVLFPCVVQAKASRYNVLYVNSYHNGYSWSDNIFSGIKSTLDASDKAIVLQVEYMDSKKFTYEDTVDTLRALYRDKFRGKRFDVIIVSDNVAFDFILRHGQELFPDVPVVFCGVNDFSPERISGKNITGIIEHFDVTANIQLALRLHPSMRRMVIIGDNSVTVRAISRQISRALPKFADKLKVDFWTNYKLEDMLGNVRRAGNDTFFYFIPMYRDIGGNFYSANELLRKVHRQTNAPLYSNWGFLLGNGIVGGKLLSGKQHGAVAASMALEVLNGTPAASIPISHQNAETWCFDYNELKRLHISENTLPPGATIINAPSTFYELNKQVFWIIIISLVILSVTLVLLMMNILEKRSVEQRIKDQLSFLRLLMDTIPIPIYSKDKLGRYQQCNEAFERFFSVHRTDIFNKNEWQISDNGLSQLHDALDTRLLSVPGVEIYEQTITPPEGTPHNIILHKATNMNARGEIAGLVGVIFDITARKQAEDSLRAAEEKYRSIFENSPLGIFRITPDGTILDVNPAIVNMGGSTTPYAMWQSLPGPLKSILDTKFAEDVAKDVVNFEHEFTREDGSKVTANMTVRIVRDTQGNVRMLEGIAEDITRRTSLERQLQQSQKMEAIGTLAGGISHDFNNILTSIINSIELALLDIASDTPTARDLERAITAAQRGSGLVKQILTFSRPSMEGFRPTNINALLEEVLELLRASFPQTIHIEQSIRHANSMTQADPTQLHQVLMNLCTNAFQSLREQGGKLSVSLEAVALEGEEARMADVVPGRYARIVVADNGPGIEQHALDKIFDPFFTTKGKTEGTGLGLAVVHGIVKNHKGGIRVTSSPNIHTAFEIYLPCLVQPDAPSCPWPEPVDPKGLERILFVEDDEDQLNTVPRVLEGLGYSVQAEQNPHKALAQIEATPDAWDVVLTDYDMPETNGLELAQRISNSAPSLPVIIVSGRDVASRGALAIPAVKATISKPYDRATLADVLRKVLGPVAP